MDTRYLHNTEITNINANSKITAMDVNNRTMGQHRDILGALNKLYEENLESLPELIIEIGTSNGGFTSLLAGHDLSKNATIHTYDINDVKPFENTNIVVHRGDIFNEFDSLKTLIADSGRVFLFCDGGNKPKEFTLFATILKQGDLIFAHDYIVDRATFERDFQGSEWNWHETKYQDIRRAVEDNGLVPYLSDVFSKVVWASFMKE